jgi:hypothetical protein
LKNAQVAGIHPCTEDEMKKMTKTEDKLFWAVDAVLPLLAKAKGAPFYCGNACVTKAQQLYSVIKKMNVLKDANTWETHNGGETGGASGTSSSSSPSSSQSSSSSSIGGNSANKVLCVDKTGSADIYKELKGLFWQVSLLVQVGINSHVKLTDAIEFDLVDVSLQFDLKSPKDFPGTCSGDYCWENTNADWEIPGLGSDLEGELQSTRKLASSPETESTKPLKVRHGLMSQWGHDDEDDDDDLNEYLEVMSSAAVQPNSFRGETLKAEYNSQIPSSMSTNTLMCLSVTVNL